MACFDNYNNTPTMNLRFGEVKAGASAAAEVTNEGTPQNPDWVVDLTLPSVGYNSVGTAQLVDKSVTTAKIADSAVTADKIADSAVTADKIANASVPINKLSNLPLSSQSQLYAHYLPLSFRGNNQNFEVLLFWVNARPQKYTDFLGGATPTKVNLLEYFQKNIQSIALCVGGGNNYADKITLNRLVRVQSGTPEETVVFYGARQNDGLPISCSVEEATLITVESGAQTERSIPLGSNAG